MLEDLFKVVTKRFNDDSENEQDKKHPKKKEDVFKCPRCQKQIPF